MIRFQCPGCRSLLQTPPERAGTIVSCGNVSRMRVPMVAPIATHAPSPLPPVAPPPAQSPAVDNRVRASPPEPILPTPPRPAQPRPQPRTRISATRTAARAPSSKQRRRPSRKPWLVAAGILAGMLVLGVAVAGGFYLLRGKSPPVPGDSLVERSPEAGEKNRLFGALDPEKPRPLDKEIGPVRPSSGLSLRRINWPSKSSVWSTISANTINSLRWNSMHEPVRAALPMPNIWPRTRASNSMPMTRTGR